MGIKSLMIGGIIPSILLGLGSVLMKMSVRAGISLPLYLCLVGLTVFAVGLSAAAYLGEHAISFRSAAFAVSMGVVWSASIFCMTYGYAVLGLPVSVVAPLTNSNAIIAIVLGSVIFAEWQQLHIGRVLCGTLLIILGATIVSTAMQK